MKNLIKHKAFVVGFVVGIFVMLFVNLYQIYLTKHPPCHHCVDWFEFPLPFYQEYITTSPIREVVSFGQYVKEFNPSGTVLNILITLFFSFLVGLLFKFVWLKISSRRLHLK